MDARGPRARRIPEIIVHDWQAGPGIDAGALASFLGATFGADTSVIRTCSGAVRAGAGGPAEPCRVTDIRNPFWRQRPGSRPPFEVPLYDGHEILRAASSVIGSCPPLDGPLHVIITDMLIGTYDDQDMRYHARPVVASNPSVLSVPGMIWGPARSRQYHAELAARGREPGGEAAVEAAHAGAHLVPGDARLRQVAEGYAMQAVFYAMTREAFCGDPGCRIYDSHWQSEVLELNSGAKLCAAHRAALDGLT